MTIDKQQLIELLDKRFTNEQLAAYFDCGITTVKRAKSKFNLVGYKTNSKPLSNKQIECITQLSTSGKTLKQIEHITGISTYTMHKYCSDELYSRILTNGKELWVSNLIKANITPIFNPNTTSAYICGVLQSDGFLTSDGYIGITTKDKDFTSQFAKFFNTSLREVEREGRVYYSCRFKDNRNLEKFKNITNIYPQKTYMSYIIPTWIKLNLDNYMEFIVGVFNGDGWVYQIPGRNTCEIGIEQHCNSKPFLQELNKFLGWSEYERDGKFRIHTKTTSKVKEFYDWYSNSSNALLRKVAELDKVFYKIQSDHLFGDVVFKRVKTGPLPFNVEYTLQVLRCKKRALTPEEIELVNAEKEIDAKYPRPTPEDVKKLLDKITSGADAEEATAAEAEAVSELG